MFLLKTLHRFIDFLSLMAVVSPVVILTDEAASYSSHPFRAEPSSCGGTYSTSCSSLCKTSGSVRFDLSFRVSSLALSESAQFMFIDSIFKIEVR